MCVSECVPMWCVRARLVEALEQEGGSGRSELEVVGVCGASKPLK